MPTPASYRLSCRQLPADKDVLYRNLRPFIAHTVTQLQHCITGVVSWEMANRQPAVICRA